MKFFKKLLRKLTRKKATEQEISDYLCQKIRKGGGVVGENVHILSSNIDMGEPYLIKIGNNVTLTGVKLLTHDACLFKTTGYTRVGKVHIGNDVFVGWGSIILPNVVIGNNVVIGAGSVVAKDIPDNCVVVGNPSRIIGSYTDLVERNKKAMEDGIVVDLVPSQIMGEEDIIKAFIEQGKGYIK